MLTSLNLAKIHLHSTNLYKNLEKETEQPTGFHETGSLRLAYTDDDLEWFNYTKGILDIVGAPCSIIGTEEIHKHHPFIKLDGIKGAFYTSEDGYTDPTSTTNAMAKGARNGGAKIYRKNRVTDINSICPNPEIIRGELIGLISSTYDNTTGSFSDNEEILYISIPGVNFLLYE